MNFPSFLTHPMDNLFSSEPLDKGTDNQDGGRSISDYENVKKELDAAMNIINDIADAANSDTTKNGDGNESANAEDFCKELLEKANEKSDLLTETPRYINQVQQANRAAVVCNGR